MTILNLPEITFAETDAATIEADIITLYEGISGVKLYPGDPVRLFLESLSAVISQQRAIIDFTGKQNLLLYSTGDYLDHLGSLTNTVRLSAAPATVTMRYAISAPLAFVVPIPAARRVTPDGQLVFETTAHAEIAIGETYVDVAAQCQATGTAGNGFVPGQINRMIDPVAYVTSVKNTTVSAGGADTEADESLRERANLAPERFSVAGPLGAYQYWAKTANQGIIDVAVYSPAACEVIVLPLMTGGALPDAEIISDVNDAVNDRSVRPLTDQVTVEAPEAADYDVIFTYYIGRGNTALSAQIQTAVTKAVSEYVLWQKTKIGRDINPDELVSRVKAAGAKRLVITSPAWQALSPRQVAQDDTVTVTYGGLEDD